MAKNEEFAKCLKFIFLRLDGELETLILADLKQLQLDDVENGDLVHTSDDKENISKGTEIVAIWNVTKQNYYLKK